MNSPIPDGILYANDSFNVASMDVSRARQILIDCGRAAEVGLNSSSSDSDWIEVANSINPILFTNYSYNIGNIIREEFGNLIVSNLANIGIKVESIGMDWAEFLSLLFTRKDEVGLFMVGWIEDYNDPSNIINSLFGNHSGP